MLQRRSLLVACLMAAVVGTGGLAHASGIQCGYGYPDTMLSTSSTETFAPYRFQEPAYSSLRSRDLEFFWPGSYGSVDRAVEKTLWKYARSLVDKYEGSNVLGYDMSRFQLVYNYCHRPSSPGPYSEDYRDTTSVAFGDSLYWNKDCTTHPCYTPTDLCHVDVYFTPYWIVIGNTEGAGGTYPSDFTTSDEDVSNRPLNTGARHVNSMAIKLPPVVGSIDTTGTRWTSPDSVASGHFGHEMQHGLGDGAHIATLALNEQHSAIAEAVVGTYESHGYDMAYTWSLMGHYSNHEEGELRGYGMNYIGRTGFAAYLVYNFPGADMSATLSGMEDDLAYQWVTLTRPYSGFDSLRVLLADATCPDCARLLDPPGAAQSDTTRMALLHHYWRGANYVNNPGLDRGQYGYPSRYGFAAYRQLNAWQNADGAGSDDVVAIPPEVTLTPEYLTRDTTLWGSRSLNGSSYPMVLQAYGSEYWIVRSDAALSASTQDLVIRVWSDSLGLATRSVYVFDDMREVTFDGRMVASVVCYSEADSGGQPAALWRHPEWADSVITPMWTDTDSLGSILEFVVPGFGTGVKAVLIPITLADGPHQGFAKKGLIQGDEDAVPFAYGEVVPYAVQLGLRSVPCVSTNPTLVAGTQSYGEEVPAFAPDGNNVAYTRRASSGERQIYVADLAGQFSSALCPSDLGQWKPDWSPRGDLLAYESLVPGWQWQVIFVCDPGHPCDASPLRVSLWGDDGDPAFSPNGQQLAFTAHLATVLAISADSVWQLHKIDASGNNDVVLVQSGADRPLTSPRWSSDGRWIYFVAGDSLYAASCDLPGTVVSRAEVAPHVASFDMRPSDGRVVMEESASATFEYYYEQQLQPFRRIAIRDTVLALTTPRFYRTGAQYYGPRWSPDGTRVAYSTDENSAGNLDLYVGQVSYNHAPQFVNAPRDTVLVGTCDATLVQSWSASDPDGEAVTFSAAYLPAGASVSAQGQLTWPAPGPAGSEHFVVVRALDGSGGIAQKVIRIAVTPDSMRPAAVADLTPTMGRTTAIVEWTAPGDDSLTGTACRTRIAYSTQQINDNNFFSCDTAAANEPGPAGTAQCAELPGLTCNRRYYFALKTQDDAGRWSALSNVATAMTSCSGYQEVLCGGDLMAQGEGESGWSLENSLLDLAAEDASVTDIYALESARATTRSSAKVRLSNRRTTGYLIKNARLEVVDHARDILAVAGRGRVLIGTALPPAGLTAADGDTLAATADAVEYAHVTSAGDVWEVMLTDDRTAGDGVLIEAGGGKPRGTTTPGGIEVQVPAIGGWRTIAWLYPRRFFGKLVADSIEADRVRLCFHDEYRIKSVERFVPAGGVTPASLIPTTVSRVASRQMADADVPTGVSNMKLESGEAVELEFALGTAAKDAERDVFLLVTGQRLSNASLAEASVPTMSGRGLAATSLPTVFRLYPAEPNPFRAGTRVRFDLPRAARLSLEVFDLQGRRVARLADEVLPAGTHVRDWNGVSERNGRIQPGVYLCRFVADGFRAQEKLVLLP